MGDDLSTDFIQSMPAMIKSEKEKEVDRSSVEKEKESEKEKSSLKESDIEDPDGKGEPIIRTGADVSK